MIKIFFDGIEIDSDACSMIKNNYSLFTNKFFLGSTASNQYSISVAKNYIQSHPSEIILKDENITLAVLSVDSVEEGDFLYTYRLSDKMTSLSFKYDASGLIESSASGFVTLLEILNDICSKANIILATTNFVNSDVQVSWYDNTKTAREYVGYIAEMMGGYATIGTDGKLYLLKHKQSSMKTINIDDCEDFKIKEYHQITRVVYDIGTLKYEFGNETGDTLYINSENPFIVNEEEVENIYNEIKDFEYYCFKAINCPIDYNIRAGNIVTFSDGSNNYPTIAQYSVSFYGSWYGDYELNLNSETVQETQNVGINEKIFSLKTELNRNNAEMKIISQNTNSIMDNLNNMYTKEQINELILNSENGLTNIFSTSGGFNIFRNTSLAFTDSSDSGFEFWNGSLTKGSEENSATRTCILLKNGNCSQSQSVLNGEYHVSFKYKKIINLAEAKVYINNVGYNLEETTNETLFSLPIDVTTKNIEVKFECDTDSGYAVYELMVNSGPTKAVYSQNQNETETDTVNISKGIEVTNTNINTKTRVDADGQRTINLTTNEVVNRNTDQGTYTKSIKVQEKADLVGMIVQEVNDHIWINFP